MAALETHKFWCSSCSAHALLGVDGVHVVAPPDDLARRHVFGHCVNCHAPGILRQEDTGEHIEEYDWSAAVQIHPALDVVDAERLPPIVRESYLEAIKCQRFGISIAGVVMVRRTLEAVGKEFAPGTPNLNRAIEVMKANGIITPELADWWHELRFIGNTGAHPSNDPPSPIDASDAFEFLEAILQIIYWLRPRFDAMKLRRKARVPAAPRAPAHSGPAHVAGDSASDSASTD